MYKIYCTRFVPFFEQKIQGLFKDTFPIFQGLHSVQKRAWSLCLFYFIHTISNFILKICLCLLLFLGSSPWTIKLAPKFKDFPAPTTIFKIFFTIFILKFTDFPGLSRCVQTLTETLNILVYISLKTEELSKPGLTL